MNRLLKVVPVILLAVSAFAQSGEEVRPPICMPVTTPGGTHHDAWANAHRIPVEVEKPQKERGYYIHPELFGQGQDKNIMVAHRPDLFGPHGLIGPKR
ncbi:MAG: hypothetical protein WB711_20790 [Terriglobales bacterium]